jgi:hypothetical protein
MLDGILVLNWFPDRWNKQACLDKDKRKYCRKAADLLNCDQ